MSTQDGGLNLTYRATFRERDSIAAALIRRCAMGEPSALEALYQAQAPRLYGLAMRITHDPGLAADAVHDTFVQVWKRAANFNPELGEAGAWLAAIVRYLAIDTKRDRAREKSVSDVPDQEDEVPSALAGLIVLAETNELHRCLALLEPKRRQMLISAYVEGLTQAQIADKYNVPLGTVKCWTKRALAQLKKSLERERLVIAAAA
jgi:RNA polymerase sigma-70 factor (ECF subfamily)